MKIAYTDRDGQLCIVTPAPGARLATKITLADGTEFSSGAPQRVDIFKRGWPVAGAVASWAESESEFLARVQAKDVPKDATDVMIVDEASIPTDRTFRNAWRGSDATISVDMVKARDIHRDHLRVSRASEFEPLERAQRTALVDGNQARARAIEVRLQALRDITADSAIEDAQTPDELKAVIPVR